MKSTRAIFPSYGVETDLVLRPGYGRSIAQFGELFQGQIEDSSGNARRCLLSLPCGELYSNAGFIPQAEACIAVSPAYKQKARRAVELAFERLKVRCMGGVLRVESNIPEAKGCGSSTADCVAAVIAAADSVSRAFTEEEIASLVVESEIASDSFMFERAVLFAHREGTVLEYYSKQLPTLVVVGIDTAEEQFVDTLSFPAAVYSREEVRTFRSLTDELREAIQSEDLALLGRVATASGLINQSYLPKRNFAAIRKIAEDAGALGVAVAHSGTVLSLLLDPAGRRLSEQIEQIRHGLGQLGISRTMHFNTNQQMPAESTLFSPRVNS